MNIKLNDVRFPTNLNSARCCLTAFTQWLDTVVTKVGEGEDAEDLFIGDIEVGTIIHCSDCNANYMLNEQGRFDKIDPTEYDLVDADVVAIPTA